MRLLISGLLCNLMLSVCLTGTAQTMPANSAQTTAPAQAATPAQAPSAPLTLETLPNKPPQAQPGAPSLQTGGTQKDADPAAKAVRLAAAEAKWGPAISAKGVTVTLKEAGRTKNADGSTLITYHLQSTGLLPDMALTLLHWPLNEPVKKMMDGIKVDAAGVAICPEGSTGTCAQSTKPGQPVELKVAVAKGEVVRAALVAADQKNGAATSVVPYPVIGEDKGCKLQMMLGTKDGELALLEGSGFAASSQMTLTAASGTVNEPINAKTDAQGHFIAAMLPWTPGNTAGDTTFSYKGDTCAVSVTFHWGKGSYHAE